MYLESHYTTESGSIHTLNIPKRKESITALDINREVTEEDIKRVMLHLVYYTTSLGYLHGAYKLVTLFPDVRPTLWNYRPGVFLNEPRYTKEQAWEEIKKELQSSGGGTSIDWKMIQYMSAKLLFPENETEIIQMFNNEYKELMGIFEDEILPDTNINQSHLKIKAVLKTLFHRKKWHMGIAGNAWETIQSNNAVYPKDVYPRAMAQDAAHFKIVFPELKNEIRLTAEDYSLLNDSLCQLRSEGKWDLFIQLAFHIKILAAEEIRITDRGLEFIMPRAQKDYFHEKIGTIPALFKGRINEVSTR